MTDPLTYRHPRTMAQAYPGERTPAFAIVPDSELAGIPSYRSTYQWQERVVIAASVLAGAATLAIIFMPFKS